MSRRPWYKRYGGDFVLGTMALSLEEKGAYSLCLDLIYDRGAPIPDDARWLAGMCGVSLRKWAGLRERLIQTGKLVAVDGCLTNARASREIAEAVAASAEHVENGAKGGRKRAENAAKHERTEPETDDGLNKNRDLGQARLKPIQKPEPDTDTSVSDARGALVRSTKEFDQFWEAYPAKIGKKAALKAWRGAKDRPAQPVVLAALDRYRRTKPADREWCNPATWINQGRWDDEDAPAPGSATSAPPVAPTFDGPPDLRAAVVRLRDEDYARRWLDHYCRWRKEDRTLLARSETVAATLRRDLADYLTDRKIRVEVAPANDIPAVSHGVAA